MGAMFNFLHPQPVGRGRPVAEQAVRHVQPALPALVSQAPRPHPGDANPQASALEPRPAR